MNTSERDRLKEYARKLAANWPACEVDILADDFLKAMDFALNEAIKQLIQFDPPQPDEQGIAVRIFDSRNQ